MKSISSRQEELKLDFEIHKYFDVKHVLRWSIHATASIIGLLTLPEIFVNYIQPKYFDGFAFWSLLGSTAIGWLGYDIVKIIEKIYKNFIKRKKLIE